MFGGITGGKINVVKGDAVIDRGSEKSVVSQYFISVFAFCTDLEQAC